MESTLDWLKEKGKLLSMEGNKPLLMTDQDQVYILIAGKIDVFSVMVENNEVVGSRKFLFEVYAGEGIFPIVPIGEEKTGFLLSGKFGTDLLVLDKKDFIAEVTKEEYSSTIVEIVDQWILNLTKVIMIEAVPRVFTSLTEGSMLSITAGEVLRSKENVLWANCKNGEALINGNKELTCLQREEYYPMTEYTWIESLEDSEVISYTTLQLLREEKFYAILERFHRSFVEVVSLIQNRKMKEQKQHFYEKIKTDHWFTQKSILELAKVTEACDEAFLEEEATDDALLTACKMVGKTMGIQVQGLSNKKAQEVSKDPLGDITKASRLHMRQVVLKEEWYKKDNGPMVAYMEEDNRPVALIPITPYKYELHDPINKTKTVINYRVAQTIKPFGYSFYRPFPNKRLKMKDLLKFGVESSWKRDIIMIIIMGLAGGLLGMLIPVATGIVFNNVIPEGERTQLIQIGFLLVSIGVADFLFQLTRSFSMLRMEGKMDGSIQAAVWDRLLSLPVPFFKDYTSGELAMRAMSITEIRKVLSGVTITTILTSIFSIFNFGLLFYYNTRLALIATIPVTISIMITVGLGYYQIRYERQLVEISKKIYGLVLQIIGGTGKFRVAGAENRAFHQWSKEFSHQRKISFKGELVANWLKTFNSFFPLVTSMIMFYMVVNSTKATLEPGKFIAFNSALTTFIGYMTSLSESLLTVNAIVPMYEATKPILETLPEYDEAKGEVGELTGAIEVNHVSFRYKKDAPLILENVSFQIKEGEYVALVGPSGSGKSTLFRILLGFENPESGQIYYNGMDMSKVDIRTIRKQLGVVLQNGQLMSGDIFTNIIGSNPNLTIEDAWTAAQMAGLDKDIKAMPMGMHTVISEGGSTLSGGQRQRLLIARAIVNRPRIIYFDEATSALDNQTQKIVSDSLDNLSATRIVIAHRLSTIMNCHRIIVLDQGKIIEEGSYQQLMKKNGVFAELAKRQLA